MPPGLRFICARRPAETCRVMRAGSILTYAGELYRESLSQLGQCRVAVDLALTCSTAKGLRQAKRLAERGWAGTVGGKQPPIGLSLVAMSRLVPPAAASRAIWVSCGVSCGPFGPARSIACSPVAAPVIRLAGRR